MAAKHPHDSEFGRICCVLHIRTHYGSPRFIYGQSSMPDNANHAIAIIGGGQAGLHMAQTLRRRGFTGAVEIFGEEPYPPYQRPPLSKAYLKGAMDEERLLFKPSEFFSTQNIKLRKSTAVTGMDRKNQSSKTIYPSQKLRPPTQASFSKTSLPPANNKDRSHDKNHFLNRRRKGTIG